MTIAINNPTEFRNNIKIKLGEVLNNEIDGSNLEKGIYFVQLQAENELIKLVIN